MSTDLRLVPLLSLAALLALAGPARAEEKVPAVSLTFDARAPGCRAALVEVAVPAQGGAATAELEARCEQAPRSRKLQLALTVAPSGGGWSVALALGSARATVEVAAGKPASAELAPWTVSVAAAPAQLAR